MRKIINEEAIIPHFQPIFCLTPFKLLGMEALSRAQTNSMLASPEMLFKAAIQYGLYEELEMLCWRKVMQQINNVCEGYKLFLNCNPYLIEGAHFSTIRSILETESFPIGNIVLEITERSAITDFKAFYEYLKRYRELGVQLAIDDVGGGYASLESIVQTKPDIVKIDRHIIKDIHEDLFKRSIVKLIVGFCRENNIVSIGEGVETKEELLAIKELGVDAAQGYLLYKPAEHIAKEQVQETEEMFIHL
ncbi:MAG: EAL domain-containing protein [Candidatus Omnitrophota bacterium]|nr:EAL domain-containing protein [Candidatus Omnitrophota bacterium]